MVLAQQSTSLGTIGGNGLGPFGNISSQGDYGGATALVNTISSVLGLMTVIGAIWFLLQVVFGGYEWMSASGDAKRIETARNRITNAFIGLVVIVAAWSILAVTGKFLGFNTLINPKDFIDSLKLQ